MSMPELMSWEKRKKQKEKPKGKVRWRLETVSPFAALSPQAFLILFPICSAVCAHSFSDLERPLLDTHKGRTQRTPGKLDTDTTHRVPVICFLWQHFAVLAGRRKTISKVNGSNGVINQVCTLQRIYSTEDMSNTGPHGAILCLCGKMSSLNSWLSQGRRVLL